MMDRDEVVSGLERTLEAYETAGPGAYTCRVEPRLIRAALDCLRETPARLLTWEELRDLPEGAVVWEEKDYSGIPPEEQREEAQEYDALPVAKMGDRLVGGDGFMPIDRDMFAKFFPPDGKDGYVRYRWWSARPTIRQMEEAAWLSGTR